MVCFKQKGPDVDLNVQLAQQNNGSKKNLDLSQNTMLEYNVLVVPSDYETHSPS